MTNIDTGLMEVLRFREKKAEMQDIITGAIIILAVILQKLGKR